MATATKKLNQQLAKVDSQSTIAMLEKMRSKVVEDEALAESYGDIASVETNIDREIDNAIASSSQAEKSKDSLADLKARLGMK